jgi:hypothetical protein
VANSVLYALPFDAEALEARGAPTAVLDGVSAAENPLTPASFTPDGRRLLYVEQRPAGRAMMQTVPIENVAGRLIAGAPEELREIPSGLPRPALSPDGRWVAYASSESGGYEIYVRAFPDDGRQWTISTGAASSPVWSRTASSSIARKTNCSWWRAIRSPATRSSRQAARLVGATPIRHRTRG